MRALEQAGELYRFPRSIVMDNGPEFTSRVLDQWAHERGIELIFIRPGKPTENAYAESFNGRVREECLNQHWFEAVGHARELCLAWRDDYNFIRPHTSLGGLSPSEFLLQSPGGHARPDSAALLNDRGHSTDSSDSPYHLHQARVRDFAWS